MWWNQILEQKFSRINRKSNILFMLETQHLWLVIRCSYETLSESTSYQASQLNLYPTSLNWMMAGCRDITKTAFENVCASMIETAIEDVLLLVGDFWHHLMEHMIDMQKGHFFLLRWTIKERLHKVAFLLCWWCHHNIIQCKSESHLIDWIYKEHLWIKEERI